MPGKSPKRSRKSNKPFWLDGKFYKRSDEKGPYMSEYVQAMRRHNPKFDCLSNYMCPPIKEVSRSRTPSPKTLRCEAEKHRRCAGKWTEKCYCTKGKKRTSRTSQSSSSSGSSGSSGSSESSASSASSRSSD